MNTIQTIRDETTENRISRNWRCTITAPENVEYNGIIYRLTTDLCVFQINRTTNEIEGYYGCYNPEDRINSENIGTIYFYSINRREGNEENRTTEIVHNNRNITLMDELPNTVLRHFRNRIVGSINWQ